MTATLDIEVADKPRSNGEVPAQLDVHQIFPSKETASYFYRFFMSPETQGCLSDDDRTGHFIYDITNNFMSGKYMAILPTVNNELAGLFYGYFINASIVECHFGIYEEFRKHSIKLTRLAAAMCFELTKAGHLMGVIANDNRRAKFCAMYSGFSPQGVIPNYFIKNGVPTDARILIKENPNAAT